MSKLEEQLLLTLSHFESMTLDKIFIDLDLKFVEENPNISMEELLSALDSLTEKKLISMKEIQGHKEWIKNFPKRKSLWRRLLNNIFGS